MVTDERLTPAAMMPSRSVIKFGKQFYHLRDDMIAWTTENFGDPVNYWESVKDGVPTGWTHTTDFGNTTFYFVTDEQVAWFRLRWDQ